MKLHSGLYVCAAPVTLTLTLSSFKVLGFKHSYRSISDSHTHARTHTILCMLERGEHTPKTHAKLNSCTDRHFMGFQMNYADVAATCFQFPV